MKKSFIFLLIFIELQYALKVSMFLHCDDVCELIKLDDKIIYKENYHNSDTFFNLPELEAERGQIIEIQVRDTVRSELRLCGEINIDGYVFSTNYEDNWIEVDGKPGINFSDEITDDYSFNCIGIDTSDDRYARTVSFKFRIPFNLDDSNYVRYEKQYMIEDLTYYLIKEESIEIDLSHFVGNQKIKLVHPLRFEFNNLKGSFIYLNNNSHVVNKGTYEYYKFQYNASNTNGDYTDIIEYYVYKYNHRIDSEKGTIKFEIRDKNIISLNKIIDCHNKNYIYKGNSKICVDNDCPSDYPYKIKDSNNKECVKFCKAPYIYLDGTQCVKSCKEGTKKYFNPYTMTCVANCNKVYLRKYNIETNECMAECQGNTNYTFLENTNECINDCYPKETYHYTNTPFQCTKSCNYNYIDLKSNKCTNNCPRYYLQNNLKFCVQNCFDNHFKDGAECLTSCDKFIIKSTNECKETCADYKFVNKTENKNYCINNCNGLFLLENSKECVENCDFSKYISEDEKTCVNNCPNKKKGNKCLANCDNNEFIDEDGKTCVNKCPNKRKGNICVEKCLESEVLINENECIDKCDNSQFIDEDGINCVNTCPNYKNRQLKKCVSNCNGMFIIENEKECVENCGNEPFIFINNENNYCESENSCKNKNYKIYKNECVKNCPKYYTNYNNNCKFDCNDIDDNNIYCKKDKTILIDLVSTYLDIFIELKKNIKGQNVDIKIINKNEKIEENPNLQSCLNNLNITNYIILKINSSNKIEFKPLYLNGKEIDISKCKQTNRYNYK